MKFLLCILLTILHLYHHEGKTTREQRKTSPDWLTRGIRTKYQKRDLVDRNAAKRQSVPTYARDEDNADVDGRLPSNYPNAPRDIHETDGDFAGVYIPNMQSEKGITDRTLDDGQNSRSMLFTPSYDRNIVDDHLTNMPLQSTKSIKEDDQKILPSLSNALPIQDHEIAELHSSKGKIITKNSQHKKKKVPKRADKKSNQDYQRQKPVLDDQGNDKQDYVELGKIVSDHHSSVVHPLDIINSNTAGEHYIKIGKIPGKQKQSTELFDNHLNTLQSNEVQRYINLGKFASHKEEVEPLDLLDKYNEHNYINLGKISNSEKYLNQKQSSDSSVDRWKMLNKNNDEENFIKLGKVPMHPKQTRKALNDDHSYIKLGKILNNEKDLNQKKSTFSSVSHWKILNKNNDEENFIKLGKVPMQPKQTREAISSHMTTIDKNDAGDYIKLGKITLSGAHSTMSSRHGPGLPDYSKDAQDFIKLGKVSTNLKKKSRNLRYRTNMLNKNQGEQNYIKLGEIAKNGNNGPTQEVLDVGNKYESNEIHPNVDEAGDEDIRVSSKSKEIEVKPIHRFMNVMKETGSLIPLDLDGETISGSKIENTVAFKNDVIAVNDGQKRWDNSAIKWGKFGTIEDMHTRSSSLTQNKIGRLVEIDKHNYADKRKEKNNSKQNYIKLGKLSKYQNVGPIKKMFDISDKDGSISKSVDVEEPMMDSKELHDRTMKMKGGPDYNEDSTEEDNYDPKIQRLVNGDNLKEIGLSSIEDGLLKDESLDSGTISKFTKTSKTLLQSGNDDGDEVSGDEVVGSGDENTLSYQQTPDKKSLTSESLFDVLLTKNIVEKKLRSDNANGKNKTKIRDAQFNSPDGILTSINGALVNVPENSSEVKTGITKNSSDSHENVANVITHQQDKHENEFDKALFLIIDRNLDKTLLRTNISEVKNKSMSQQNWTKPESNKHIINKTLEKPRDQTNKSNLNYEIMNTYLHFIGNVSDSNNAVFNNSSTNTSRNHFMDNGTSSTNSATNRTFQAAKSTPNNRKGEMNDTISFTFHNHSTTDNGLYPYDLNQEKGTNVMRANKATEKNSIWPGNETRSGLVDIVQARNQTFQGVPAKIKISDNDRTIASHGSRWISHNESSNIPGAMYMLNVYNELGDISNITKSSLSSQENKTTSNITNSIQKNNQTKLAKDNDAAKIMKESYPNSQDNETMSDIAKSIRKENQTTLNTDTGDIAKVTKESYPTSQDNKTILDITMFAHKENKTTFGKDNDTGNIVKAPKESYLTSQGNKTLSDIAKSTHQDNQTANNKYDTGDIAKVTKESYPTSQDNKTISDIINSAHNDNQTRIDIDVGDITKVAKESYPTLQDNQTISDITKSTHQSSKTKLDKNNDTSNNVKAPKESNTTLHGNQTMSDITKSKHNDNQTANDKFDTGDIAKATKESFPTSQDIKTISDISKSSHKSNQTLLYKGQNPGSIATAMNGSYLTSQDNKIMSDILKSTFADSNTSGDKGNNTGDIIKVRKDDYPTFQGNKTMSEITNLTLVNNQTRCHECIELKSGNTASKGIPLDLHDNKGISANTKFVQKSNQSTSDIINGIKDLGEKANHSYSLLKESKIIPGIVDISQKNRSGIATETSKNFSNLANDTGMCKITTPMYQSNTTMKSGNVTDLRTNSNATAHGGNISTSTLLVSHETNNVSGNTASESKDVAKILSHPLQISNNENRSIDGIVKAMHSDDQNMQNYLENVEGRSNVTRYRTAHNKSLTSIFNANNSHFTPENATSLVDDIYQNTKNEVTNIYIPLGDGSLGDITETNKNNNSTIKDEDKPVPYKAQDGVHNNELLEDNDELAATLSGIETADNSSNSNNQTWLHEKDLTENLTHNINDSVHFSKMSTTLSNNNSNGTLYSNQTSQNKTDKKYISNSTLGKSDHNKTQSSGDDVMEENPFGKGNFLSHEKPSKTSFMHDSTGPIIEKLFDGTLYDSEQSSQINAAKFPDSDQGSKDKSDETPHIYETTRDSYPISQDQDDSVDLSSTTYDSDKSSQSKSQIRTSRANKIKSISIIKSAQNYNLTSDRRTTSKTLHGNHTTSNDMSPNDIAVSMMESLVRDWNDEGEGIKMSNNNHLVKKSDSPNRLRSDVLYPKRITRNQHMSMNFTGSTIHSRNEDCSANRDNEYGENQMPRQNVTTEERRLDDYSINACKKTIVAKNANSSLKGNEIDILKGFFKAIGKNVLNRRNMTVKNIDNGEVSRYITSKEILKKHSTCTTDPSSSVFPCTAFEEGVPKDSYSNTNRTDTLYSLRGSASPRKITEVPNEEKILNETFADENKMLTGHMLQRAALRSELLNGNIPDIKTLDDYDLTVTENPVYGSIIEGVSKPENSISAIAPFLEAPVNTISSITKESDISAVKDPQFDSGQFISNDEELLRTYDDNVKLMDRETISHPNKLDATAHQISFTGSD